MRVLVVALLIMLFLSPTYAAQPAAGPALPFTIGVIVSREGAARSAGAAQSLATAAFASRLRAHGGIFGRGVEVLLRDDAGDPRAAGRLSQELIDEGVSALVCCTTKAAAKIAASVADTAGVPLLSPAGLSDQHYWAFGLALSDGDDLVAIVADAHRRGIWSFALMTLDNSFGSEAAEDLTALLQYAGMGLVGDVRYPPGATDLRPEALWTATRQPGAVVIWGLKDDLLVAVDGLRRRGYTGPIYARSALLDPVSGGLDLTRLDSVRFSVPVSSVADGLAPTASCRTEAAAVARNLEAAYAGVIDVALATPMYDALELLRLGLEQVAILPVPTDHPAVERQALRDSLVGLPPTCGGGGSYDLREGSSQALQPNSVAFAVVAHGDLTPLP